MKNMARDLFLELADMLDISVARLIAEQILFTLVMALVVIVFFGTVALVGGLL